MMEDVTHDPVTRLREWTRLLAVGNFATLAIEEDDEKFVIAQRPCGSRGRQDDHNRGELPWNLRPLETHLLEVTCISPARGLRSVVVDRHLLRVVLLREESMRLRGLINELVFAQDEAGHRTPFTR
jgi:hypothetical protein